MKPSRLHFNKNLPRARTFGPATLLIFDRRLLRVDPKFREWSSGFSARYGVKAGESLKELRGFPRHMERVLRLTRDFNSGETTIVAVGGGSVGDFAGFVASTLKRGVRLVHIPSTWLAAIDSSHGGKTALNALGGKNQVGTFYPAADIYLVNTLLRTQPSARALEAYGELVKIALLDGRPWIRRLEDLGAEPSQLLLRFLPIAIDAKMRIVRRDPYEKTGARRLLNLGHTFGHVLEADAGFPHGVAVAQGMHFAVRWSLKRRYLSRGAYDRIIRLLRVSPSQRPLLKSARARLLQDKKRNGVNEVNFIFLKGIGRPVCISVKIDELLDEALEQGWIR